MQSQRTHGGEEKEERSAATVGGELSGWNIPAPLNFKVIAKVS